MGGEGIAPAYIDERIVSDECIASEGRIRTVAECIAPARTADERIACIRIGDVLARIARPGERFRDEHESREAP